MLCLFEIFSLWIYPLISLIFFVFAFKRLFEVIILFFFVTTLLTIRYSSLIKFLRIFSVFSVICICILGLNRYSSHFVCFYNYLTTVISGFYLSFNWVDFCFSFSGFFTPFLTEAQALLLSPSYFRRSLSSSVRLFSQKRALSNRRFKYKSYFEAAPSSSTYS